MISEICTCDLDGTVTVVARLDGHFEAPNWHPDGYLIINGGGRIYRVPLDNPLPELIPTGDLANLNNDHGLSPDARTLAVSQTTGRGTSVIYLVPVTGGEPKRVTPLAPSWWHGWSPDGATLAYVGARNDGPVLLYTCALDGSGERLLTPDFDHVDGPDYSPDGKWIWFNGERDGSVDLWRIHPDGTGLEKMTTGPTVDWFPHPSPDGDWVVWLAYPAGTQGHPANLDVTLNLMPAAGGQGRVLVTLLGGQGTINVPSWAPDSRRFAFVRFEP